MTSLMPQPVMSVFTHHITMEKIRDDLGKKKSNFPSIYDLEVCIWVTEKFLLFCKPLMTILTIFKCCIKLTGCHVSKQFTSIFLFIQHNTNALASAVLRNQHIINWFLVQIKMKT